MATTEPMITYVGNQGAADDMIRRWWRAADPFVSGKPPEDPNAHW